MWQRIQTVYLLLAAVAMTLLLFLPMGIATDPLTGTYKLTATIFFNTTDLSINPGGSWGLLFVAAISVLTSFVTVFLFRKRILQIRLSIFNILVIIGFLVFFGIEAYQFCHTAGFDFGIKVWLALPLIAIILLWLAIRAIGADEALVRASNRLR